MQVGTWQGRGRDIEREAEVGKAAPPLPPAATSQGRTGETPAEAPPQSTDHRPQRSQVLFSQIITGLIILDVIRT